MTLLNFIDKWEEYILEKDIEDDLIKLLQDTAIISCIIGLLIGILFTILFFEVVILK